MQNIDPNPKPEVQEEPKPETTEVKTSGQNDSGIHSDEIWSEINDSEG